MCRHSLLLAVILALTVADRSVAQDAKRLDQDKATKIATALISATANLSDLPIKITPDAQRAMGVAAQERGGIVVPDSRLTAEALKSVDKNVLPIGLLFLHRITPTIAEKVTTADQLRQVTITEDGKPVDVGVLLLGVTRVADRLVLVVYGSGKSPLIVTTLIDANESKDSPLELDPRPNGNGRATVLVTVLSGYRAGFDIVVSD